jgi:hypothetical protein
MKKLLFLSFLLFNTTYCNNVDNTLLKNEGIMNYKNENILIIKKNYLIEKNKIDDDKNKLKSNLLHEKNEGVLTEERKYYYKNELEKLDLQEKILLNTTNHKISKIK